MKLVMIFPLILYLFAAFTSPTTVSAQKEEEDIIVGHRRLQETELFADDDAMIPTAVSASPLKCKNSDSKLQLQLQTATGDTIPFFCAWAQKGRFSCTGTGPLASHCPKACSACSKYKCADSEGDFIWKGEVRTCSWLNAKKQKNIEKLCKNKPKLATTCRATCNMCGVAPTSTPTSYPSEMPSDAPISNVKSYSFSSNMLYGKTMGPNGFYGTYIKDGFMVAMVRMIPGWISPEMLNVNVNEQSTLNLTFDYKLYNVDQDPCPADQKLYIRLRLTTGPNDWFGNVATTELVGPLTADQGSYSAEFDSKDDIVGLAQDGYAYLIDTIIPGAETDTYCTGTYHARGFSVTTNFASYDWQEP